MLAMKTNHRQKQIADPLLPVIVPVHRAKVVPAISERRNFVQRGPLRRVAEQAPRIGKSHVQKSPIEVVLVAYGAHEQLLPGIRSSLRRVERVQAEAIGVA